MFFTSSVQAEQYQRVKQILDCVVKISTPLKREPKPRAGQVEMLESKQVLQILGKQGNWLDAQSRTSRGWISTFYVEVVGVSRNQQLKKLPRPSTITKKTKRVRNVQAVSDIRFVPFASYVVGGKNFYDQIRLGTYATYKAGEQFSVGLLAEAVLFRGSYLALGPTMHRSIATGIDWFKPSLQASLLYYKFNHGADDDQGGGVQWALENDFLVIQTKKLSINPVLRTGFDLMLISMETVRVPYFFSAAVAMKF